MPSSSKYSGYFEVETICTILVAFALLQISNQIRSVNNSGFYKNLCWTFTTCPDQSPAGVEKSDIVQLNGALTYL